MTFKYDKVYLNETYTVVGPYEDKGPLGKYFDNSYEDLYCEADSWEKAETKLLEESMKKALRKNKLTKENILKTQKIKMQKKTLQKINSKNTKDKVINVKSCKRKFYKRF